MRRFRILGVLLLVTLLSTFAIPFASAAADAQVQVGSGRTAVVDFFTIDGCVAKETFVFATDQNLKQAPGPFSTAAGGLLIVSETDLCLGTQTFESGNFESIDLKFNNVRSATVNGTAIVSDANDPNATRTYDVSLTFVSTGATQPITDHFNVQFPGGQRLTYHATGFFALATATGSVVATDTGVNVITGLTGTGTLDQHRQGAVWIIKN